MVAVDFAGIMTRVVCPDLVRLGFPTVHPTTDVRPLNASEVCDECA
jgi:hypothetical protein